MKLSCRSGGGCLGGEDGGGFSLGEMKEREKRNEMEKEGYL